MFGSLFGGKKKDLEGIDLIKAGKDREAHAHFQARLQADPHAIDALLELAKMYFRKKDYPQTKEHLKRALKEDLTEEDIETILGMTNFRKLGSDKHLNSHPSFSQDGRWVIFSSTRRDTNGDGRLSQDDRPGIFAVNIETGKEALVASDDFYNSQPSFSADGQRAVYLSARTDTNKDGKIDHTDSPSIYVKDLSTGKEECVLDPSYRPKFPSFSPDGRHILFCAWHAQSKGCGVYLLDLNDKKVRTLQGVWESNFPVFSPKGDRIIYSSWRTDTNRDGVINITDNSVLCELSMVSGIETILVPDIYSNSYAHFAPDGDSILYLSRRRDTNGDGVINSLQIIGIYAMDLNSRKERAVVGDDHYNKFPAFSADGRYVVFLGSWRTDKSPKEGQEQTEYFDNKGIHCVNASGKNEREIVSTKHYGCRFLCTSPKKNYVAFVSWRRDTNRGLYLAPIDRAPTKQELANYVENNI